MVVGVATALCERRIPRLEREILDLGLAIMRTSLEWEVSGISAFLKWVICKVLSAKSRDTELSAEFSRR